MLGDAELVGDVLQAGALHTLLLEQLTGDALNALAGVRTGPAHFASLSDLPIGK
jgi:hypothetical protein